MCIRDRLLLVNNTDLYPISNLFQVMVVLCSHCCCSQAVPVFSYIVWDEFFNSVHCEIWPQLEPSQSIAWTTCVTDRRMDRITVAIAVDRHLLTELICSIVSHIEYSTRGWVTRPRWYYWRRCWRWSRNGSYWTAQRLWVKDSRRTDTAAGTLVHFTTLTPSLPPAIWLCKFSISVYSDSLQWSCNQWHTPL